jgi:hypothetical protein
MSCTKIGEFCKRPDEKVPLRIPLAGSAFIKYFQGSEIVATGDYRRPKKPNGYEYEVDQGGQCGRREPDWPTSIGQRVASGSAVFICRAISNNSLARVIASCTWNGGGLTITGEGIVNTDGELEVFAYAAGGNTGESGQVVARITFNDGAIEDAILDYSIS